MKLLMLGTSNGSVEMLQYAKSQGIYTIVTDGFSPEYSLAKSMADEYWMIDTGAIDELEDACRKNSVNSVICGISEFNQDQVIKLTERLGLPCYCTASAWSYGRDKKKFKNLCRSLGIRVPCEFSVQELLKKDGDFSDVYPVVVKPVDMCSNRGVSFCNNREEVIQAVCNIRSDSEKSEIIAEKKLVGEEFLALYALAEGKSSLLTLYACYHQPGQPSYCYSVNTTAHNKTSAYLAEFNDKAMELLERAGCTDGVGWIELMLNEDGHFYAIEMGYRLPGDMIFLPLKNTSGFDVISWLVDCSCGKKHLAGELPVPYDGKQERYATAYLLWTKQEGTIAEISGLEKLAGLPCQLVAKSARTGDKIDRFRPLYTIVFDTGNTEEIYRMLEKINECIRVKNTKGEEMLIYFTDYNVV